KFVVRRTFLRPCLTTNLIDTDARALGSPRGGAVMPLCGMTQRGASHVYGRGGPQGRRGPNSETSKTKPHKYTKLPPPTSKIRPCVLSAKRAGKIGNKEKKAKTKK